MRALRIFHSADWHLGKPMGNIDRTADYQRFIDDFMALVAERRPDVILLSGDIFDTSMPATAAQRLYYDFIRRLADTGVTLTVITAGNHDSQRFLEAPRELLRTFRVVIAGESREAQAVVMESPDGTPLLGIAAVPYLREGDVRAGSLDYSDGDRAELFEAGVRAHYDAVQTLLRNKAPGVPLVAMGHLFVTGARLRPTDTAEQKPASEGGVTVGSLRNVTADAFGTGWCYVALGHIHSAQTLESPVPMRYSGSPLSLSYHHRLYRHHIVEADIAADGAVSFTELPVPQHREFLSLAGSVAELTDGIREAGLAHRARTEADPDMAAFPPFIEAALTSDEAAGNLADDLQHKAAEAGVIITAVRNEPQVRRYLAHQEADIDLSQLNPAEVFRRFLRENSETDENANAAFVRFSPLFNEITEELHANTRHSEAGRSTPDGVRAQNERLCAGAEH